MLEIEYRFIDYNIKNKKEVEHNIAYNLLYDMLFKHFDIKSPTIKRTDKNKPYIEMENVHFSISHTNGLVACAVSDTPVGIDCEGILPRDDKSIQNFANRYFLENEINLLKSNEFSLVDFYKIWTAKEAIYKAEGGTNYITKIDTTKHTVNYIFEKDYIICVKN